MLFLRVGFAVGAFEGRGVGVLGRVDAGLLTSPAYSVVGRVLPDSAPADTSSPDEESLEADG